MKNAIDMPSSHKWYEFTTINGMARFLCNQVFVEGRLFKSYGKIILENFLMYDDESLLQYKDITLFYGLLDEGMLLIEREVFPCDASNQIMWSLLWITDVRDEEDPFIKECLVCINTCKPISRCSYGNVRNDMYLVIDKSYMLPDYITLYAFPLTEMAESYFLTDVRDLNLYGLALMFSASNHFGFLDLGWCDFYHQDTLWKYSKALEYIVEPRISVGVYCGYYLISGKASSLPNLIWNEFREFFSFANPYYFELFPIDALLDLKIQLGDMDYGLLYVKRKRWKKILRYWLVFLEQESWDGFVETLKVIDIQNQKWHEFIQTYRKRDLCEIQRTLLPLFYWIKRVLQDNESISLSRLF